MAPNLSTIVRNGGTRLASILILIPALLQKLQAQTTHHLQYDSVIPGKSLAGSPSIRYNDDGMDDSNINHDLKNEMISPDLALSVTINVSDSILFLWRDVLGNGSYGSNDADINSDNSRHQHCYQSGGPVSRGGSVKCLMDRWENDNGINIVILNSFFLSDGGDKSDQILIGSRWDITVTTKEVGLSKNILIDCLPNIATMLQSDTDEGSQLSPSWSLHERPPPTFSSCETPPDTLIDTSLHRSSSSSETSNLDNDVLAPFGPSKTRLATLPSLEAEIWSYMTTTTVSSSTLPAREQTGLFLSSQLRLVSSSASTVAHAEAFVHPAMVSHPDPSNVLLVSLIPFPYLKEILRHDDLDEIDVVFAIGESQDVDDAWDLVELVSAWMPSMDDCLDVKDGSGVKDDGIEQDQSCLTDSRVQMINQTADEWINDMINRGNENHYDVIYIMAPESSPEVSYLLSLTFQKRLKRILDDEEGILVVNSGSAPELLSGVDDHYAEQVIMHENAKAETIGTREYFLRQVTRTEEFDGLAYQIALVYDEPLASPFDSTFILSFPGYTEAHSRFLRKKPTAVDLDLLTRLQHPSKASTTTTSLSLQHYDGPTHVGRYIYPSRAWEDWYCRTHPGKTMPICTTFLPHYATPSRHFRSGTEVRLDPIKGRSLYATRDIPAHHFVLSDDIVDNVLLEAEEFEALKEFVDLFPGATLYAQFRDLILAYGYEVENLGNTGWGASLANNNTFTNHACSSEDATVEPMVDVFLNEDGLEDSVGFSPPIVRRPVAFGQLAMTKRDLVAGEELMIDYGTFRAKESHPNFHDEFLGRNVCTEKVGMIPVGDE